MAKELADGRHRLNRNVYDWPQACELALQVTALLDVLALRLGRAPVGEQHQDVRTEGIGHTRPEVATLLWDCNLIDQARQAQSDAAPLDGSHRRRHFMFLVTRRRESARARSGRPPVVRRRVRLAF